jgi:hypothetical protein
MHSVNKMFIQIYPGVILPVHQTYITFKSRAEISLRLSQHGIFGSVFEHFEELKMEKKLCTLILTVQPEGN